MEKIDKGFLVWLLIATGSTILGIIYIIRPLGSIEVMQYMGLCSLFATIPAFWYFKFIGGKFKHEIKTA